MCVCLPYVSNMQTASFLRHILSSVTCPASSYFSALSHKQHNFLKKVIEHTVCVLILSTTFVQSISHFNYNLARHFHRCTHAFMQSTCYSSDFNKTQILLSDFRQILK